MTLPAKAPDPAEARPAAAAVPAVQLRDVAVTRGGCKITPAVSTRERSTSEMNSLT